MELAVKSIRTIMALVGVLLFILVVLFIIFQVVIFLIPVAIVVLLLGYFFRMLNKMKGRGRKKEEGKNKEYVEAKYREVK